VSCKIIVNRETGLSRGFAFIEFETPEVCNKVIADAANIKIGDKPVVVRRAGEPKPKVNFDKNVYVGNLAFSVTEDTLHSFFSKCGKIANLRYPKNPTGGYKGFCFIEFETEDGLKNALMLNLNEIEGRQIRVSKQESRDSSKRSFEGGDRRSNSFEGGNRERDVRSGDRSGGFRSQNTQGRRRDGNYDSYWRK